MKERDIENVPFCYSSQANKLKELIFFLFKFPFTETLEQYTFM